MRCLFPLPIPVYQTPPKFIPIQGGIGIEMKYSFSFLIFMYQM